MEAAAARVAMDQSGNYWLLWLQIYIYTNLAMSPKFYQ